MKIKEILEHKGMITTVIGMIIGFPSSILMTVLLCIYKDFKYIPFSIAFGIAIIFFMMPSSFKFKFKDIEIEVKD